MSQIEAHKSLSTLRGPSTNLPLGPLYLIYVIQLSVVRIGVPVPFNDQHSFHCRSNAHITKSTLIDPDHITHLMLPF